MARALGRPFPRVWDPPPPTHPQANQVHLKEKTNYKQLLHSQKLELAFGDRLHASYLQVLLFCTSRGQV